MVIVIPRGDLTTKFRPSFVMTDIVLSTMGCRVVDAEWSAMASDDQIKQPSVVVVRPFRTQSHRYRITSQSSNMICSAKMRASSCTRPMTRNVISARPIVSRPSCLVVRASKLVSKIWRQILVLLIQIAFCMAGGENIWRAGTSILSGMGQEGSRY